MNNVKRYNGNRWIWMTLFFILYSLFFSVSAHAQTFTQRIQQKGQRGEGTVTVTHDKAIDDLVNGRSGESRSTTGDSKAGAKTAQQSQTHPQKEKEKEKEKDDSTARRAEARQHEQAPDTAQTDSLTVDTRRKVMRGIKVNGYRVQAFAGGNQRKDRQKAEQIGATIKAHYPDVPIYVHFYSPRWICRVGNYQTYEEAHQMLVNIRNLGISGASVVKGKITVKY